MTPLWSPTPERVADANLTRFTRFVTERHQVPLRDYSSLHRWSIEYPEHFWGALWDFCDVRATQRATQILEDGHLLPGARWFVGASFNYAENLLRLDDESPAIVFRNEQGLRREMSFRELRAHVARIADGLRRAGVVEGDRVAGLLPNLPETIIAMLATASIGAIWSSCSPDFGVSAVLDRFGQISPKVLFVVDGYPYAGKRVDALATAREVARQIGSLARIVVVPYLGSTSPPIEESVSFGAFGATGAQLTFAQLPFEQPLFILYSSGTTGPPKCIVHGAGGALLQQLKEHVLHADVKPGDRYFYFTTCGWVMWNAVASALAANATIVLYDGSPLQPDPRILWRIASEEQLTHFGTSPRFLTASEQAGVRPAQDFDLGALRTIISTGSPLNPQSYGYVYRDVKPDVQLASISGGTDLMACFGAACPTLPVYEGEIQCLALGMKVEIYDDEGRPIIDAQGELVCSAPFPSVPIGLWGDVDGSRLHATYFARYPNVWHHGDFATVTSRDTLIVHGRSDAVLNPGGVRIGTAEIYRQIEKIPEIAESIAIAQQWQGDVRIVLFVRLRDELKLDDALAERIRTTLRAHATPRHVPARIYQVPDLPRTMNGKLVEIAVREAVHGRPVRNTDALANPEALEYFKNLEDLQR